MKWGGIGLKFYIQKLPFFHGDIGGSSECVSNEFRLTCRLYSFYYHHTHLQL